jgi:transcriptional regulator with XRE-family HTH domain
MSDLVPQNGSSIKHLRLKDGWKQRDLASQAGITQSALSYIEAERHPASDLVINRLARALRVPVAAITRDRDYAANLATAGAVPAQVAS